jgi:hypothetical protein
MKLPARIQAPAFFPLKNKPIPKKISTELTGFMNSSICCITPLTPKLNSVL